MGSDCLASTMKTSGIKDMEWDKLSQFEQAEYIEKAELLLSNGYWDEDVDVMAKMIYDKQRRINDYNGS